MSNFIVFLLMVFSTGFLLGIGLFMVVIRYQVKKGRIPAVLSDLGVRINESNTKHK